LAEIYFRASRFIEASDLADRAIALGRAHFGALLTRANACFSLRRLEDAEAAYHSALAIAPGNLDCMMNLASISEIRGDEALAESWYLRILDTHPGQDVALRRLALAQTRNGLDVEVADVLYRACADTMDAQCLVLVGSLFEKAGKLERASELYRSAATRKPEWAGAMNRRAQQLLSDSKQGRNTHDSIGI
jgi:tetratricopeptide (TPR) repeat protein